MEWSTCYVDVIFGAFGILMYFGYHLWLWHRVRTQPHTTIIGINASGRRNWDNEKKNILAVQSLRNTIMGSTLMAATSILLCSGLAAVISSTYSVKKPHNDTVYGAHGEFMVALKYVTLLTIFLFSFFCHSLSIRFRNQVNILTNTPQDPTPMVTPQYIHGLLEKGFILNTLEIGSSTWQSLFWFGSLVLSWSSCVLALSSLFFTISTFLFHVPRKPTRTSMKILCMKFH
ncbi:hypothetical protein K1719_022158 [Acacia pycnantha]|nr:hypothetical protein K1719_022158 [Acacia pycnantha]